jgi:hypothetical protein
MYAAAAILLKGVTERPGPVLTERELLRVVIDFANDGSLGDPLIRAPGIRFLPPHGAGPNWQPTAADVVPPERLTNVRAQLRADLAAAIGKGFTPPDAQRIRAAAREVVAIPIDYESVSTRTRPRQRYVRTRWYFIPMSLEAILARAVLWLRDETLGLGADLRQCALQRCRAFFFASEKAKARGRPRIYCRDDHMNEAHEATGAERTRKWRERASKHK